MITICMIKGIPWHYDYSHQLLLEVNMNPAELHNDNEYTPPY